MRMRPLGWLEEFSKLEVMASAASSAHLLTSNIIWPVHCSDVLADKQEHCAAKPGDQHSKGFLLLFFLRHFFS